MNLDSISAELKELRQWVVWRDDKHPRNALNPSEHASVSDPSTWCTFEEACAAVRNKKAVGAGFVFSEDDDYVAVDLDKAIDEDGNIDPSCQEIIDRLDSYTEISKSGRGIHIIGIGKKPGSRCRKGNVEIYDEKRYFALTGDLWEDRAEIKEFQEALDWLCSDVFGDEDTAATKIVEGIELNSDAKPPIKKFKALYRDSDDFKNAWDYDDENLKSMSDYDFKLAVLAYDDGWTNQEIADLIIAFRRRHGNKDDVAKSLRPDYIPRTIGKIKQEEGVYKKLFESQLKGRTVRRILRYGTEDSEYDIELDDDTKIRMGNSESFLSSRRARAKLYDAGFFIDANVMKRWDKIMKELLDIVENITVESREDTIKDWLNEYIGGRISIPKIEEEDDIGEIFASGRNTIASDDKGRIYVRISGLARFAKMYTGLGGVSVKSVAHDLIELGFVKRKIYMTTKGRRRQISLWVSPIGYIEESE